MKNLISTTIVLVFILAGSCQKENISEYVPVVYESHGITLTPVTYNEGKSRIGTAQRYIAVKADTTVFQNADSVVYTWLYESTHTATAFSYNNDTASLVASAPDTYKVQCQARLYKGAADTLLYGSVAYYVSDTTVIYFDIGSGGGLF
jgi:hypothetical protein